MKFKLSGFQQWNCPSQQESSTLVDLVSMCYLKDPPPDNHSTTAFLQSPAVGTAFHQKRAADEPQPIGEYLNFQGVHLGLPDTQR